MAEERRTEIRSLKCELTRPEIAARAEQVSMMIGDRDTLEKARKVADGQAKEEIKALDESMYLLARTVREKAEYRDIECSWVRNDAAKLFSLVRDDTGEVIFERPLSSEEQQVHLFPARGGKPAPPGGKPVPKP